jgi:hypothetical protein
MSGFDHLKGIVPPEAIVSLNQEMEAQDRLDFSTSTTEEMHIYADGTSGDDENTGLTADSPKKTLAATYALVPDVVKHNTTVHLSGTFVEYGYPNLSTSVKSGIRLLIDGGDDLTAVAGPWMADTSSVSTIGSSGLSLTPDEHTGYWIEIIDGAAAGERRTIKSHDGTTFTVTLAFSVDPGSVQFRVVKPTTALQGDNAWWNSTAFNCKGQGVWIQRLRLTGVDGQLWLADRVTMSNVICENSFGDPMWVQQGTQVELSNFSLVPTTWGYDNVINRAGVSFTNSSNLLTLKHSRFDVRSAVIQKVSIDNCTMTAGTCFSAGTRIRSTVTISGMKDYTGYLLSATVIDGGATVSIKDSAVGISGGSISDQTGHGITLNNSILRFGAAVAGTGNGGAGVYMSNRSSVIITSGTPPTLTGTAGNCSLDGSTGFDLGSGTSAFWTDVDAGTYLDGSVANNDEFCNAKEA